MEKQIHVGQKIRFGVSRMMTVAKAEPFDGGGVVQRITLVGPRGGTATALVFRSGRIRMV